ncbi:MAG: FliA/WhiG family RNA polymerase sigma factor [Anaerolineales bacterium]|nr:FliA/WhiG family RNA polymerase sigma factor [Anaerolineales bacterium]
MNSKRDDAKLINQYVATHEPALREEIILRYVPLVHFVLGRLGLSQALGQDYEDAASQGLLGLIEAVDRFDPGYKTQFSTYATLRIRGNVIDHLRMHDWLSRSARQKTRLVQDAISVLWEKNERPPTDEELAEYLNLSIDKLRQILVDSSHVFVSLDTTVSAEGDDIVSLHELITDENQLEPSEIFEEEEMKSILVEAIQSLPEREQLVLSLYYYENLTFKEIGAVLDVSESRVCQLHARIVMTLRGIIENKIHKVASAEKNLTHQNEQTNDTYSVKPSTTLAGGKIG